MEKEFVENILGYKVKTHSGYVNFSGVAYMGDKHIIRTEFENGSWIETSNNHTFFNDNLEEFTVSEAKIGDLVFSTNNSTLKITNIIDTGKVEPTYDLVDVQGNRSYFTNNVLSHNCEFITAEETLIASTTLRRLCADDSLFDMGSVRWYSKIKPNRMYLVGLDPATGTAVSNGDSAAIQIFALPEMEQVGEWCTNKVAAKGQVETLLSILRYIHTELQSFPEQIAKPEDSIYWTFENNGIGEAIGAIIKETGEEKFPGCFLHEPRRAGRPRSGPGRLGLTTSAKPKLTACIKFKSLIETERMKVHSKGLVSEMKNYIKTSLSFAAKPGCHDDLVSATLLCVRLLDIVKDFDPELTDQLRDVIELDGETDAPMPFVLMSGF